MRAWSLVAHGLRLWVVHGAVNRRKGDICAKTRRTNSIGTTNRPGVDELASMMNNLLDVPLRSKVTNGLTGN